jgi:hypothetical protein
MTDRIQEVEETTVTDGAPVQTTRKVVRDTDNRAVARGASTAERLIYYVTGVLITLLAFRFVLSLLGANRSNGFADLIYGLSYPFVAPFFGLFGYSVQYGVARFEIETLVAMAVYALVGFAIAKLVSIARRAD